MYAAQDARAEGEGDSDRVEPLLADSGGEQGDPGGRHRDPEKVTRAPGADERDAEWPDELEGDRDSERDPVDRLVEAEVHRHEREPESDGQLQLAGGAVPH